MGNSILQEDLEGIHGSIGRRERFDGATIVITGCAGFLGFYIMQYLVQFSKVLGIKKIIGLDSFVLGKPDWLSGLASQSPGILDVHEFDISRDHIANVEGSKDARFVVHGASIASPTFYRKFPLETIDANIWGLRTLFDFYRGSQTLEGFLYFSSSEIYGDPDAGSIPTDENYRGNVACVGPRACYDESKRFGETMCYVFAKHHNIPVTVVRPFNNYGPGMRVDDRRLPADFAQCILGNKDIVILSDGAPTRTFCYVSDAVTGYLLALLYGKFDSFNIGIEGPEISVSRLAEIYCSAGKDIFGYGGEVQFRKSADPEYMTDNPNRRCPVIKKAREILGYEPVILVEEGVGRYLRFLKAEGVAV
jgi:UDP-glucuronate decarboxylase